MLEEFATYAAVAVAATCASRQLLPGRWRSAILGALTSLGGATGWPAGNADRERVITEQSPCGRCGGCARPPQPISTVIVSRPRTGGNSN